LIVSILKTADELINNNADFDLSHPLAGFSLDLDGAALILRQHY
jgi:hypothetical protein